MRRLWSHIIIAATSLLMVGATFATVVTNIDSNIEFTPGKEFVFRVARKGEDGNPDESFVMTKDSLDEVNKIADKMEERLKKIDISRYKVEVQGYDTISVSLSTSEDQYSIIQNYLPFNGTLAISNSKNDYALSDQFLDPNQEAYVEVTDGYPQVIIPINKENEYFKKVYDEAKKMSDNNEGEVEEETEEEGEDGEHKHVNKAYLYLWYDFVEEYYSYDKIGDPNSETYNPTVASKVLMRFDAANAFFTKDGEEQSALMTYVTPSDGVTSEITPEILSETYRNATYYVNLLNAGTISEEYTTSLLFTNKANVWVEELVSLGSQMTVAWSRTFIATLCAIVVVSLLLIYFYRLGALSVATTSIVSTFFGLLFVVLFSAEFNIAGIVGLISVAITSIISGVIYLNKIKEECYRGRSLKKANSEAAKKALLPTIDVHFVLVAVGVAAYLLGGNLMKAFALSTVLGGLVSLVLAIFGLRGLLWLVTNEPGIANRYDLFDVSKEQIPNALEEEKQKYYGPNADKDLTKYKKPVGIVSAVLLLASVVTLIVVGVINKGAVYNSSSSHTSQVYVEYRSSTADNTALSASTKESINKMLENSVVNGNKLADISEVESYAYTPTYRTTKSSVDTIYYGYYRINFNVDFSDAKKNMISYNGKDAVTPETFFDIEYLNSASDANLDFDDVNVVISLKNGVPANVNQPEFKSLILATTVAAGISFIYLLLRYRLSRGLAVLGITTLSVGISAGIFSMLYFLPVSSYISVALPFIALFTFDIAILFMNKEREMVLEDRSKDNSLEARESLMKKALGISSTPITVVFCIALFLGVNFFGFMFTEVSYVFLLIILGVVIATCLVLFLFGPMAHVLYKWFSNIAVRRQAKEKESEKKNEKKAKKARPVRVKKSAEPEEAIFIGIND